tara:strand:+ start:195 stop:542 length:348 start_codon:yes stop_codon:yes gene_type:complete
MIISNLNPGLIKWDLLIISLSVWSCIVIPLHLSFFKVIVGVGEWFSKFVDICFAIDILIVFRTSYIDLATGGEITNGWSIAKNYLLGNFVIDFLSAMPFDLILLWIRKDLKAEDT